MRLEGGTFPTYERGRLKWQESYPDIKTGKRDKTVKNIKDFLSYQKVSSTATYAILKDLKGRINIIEGKVKVHVREHLPFYKKWFRFIYETIDFYLMSKEAEKLIRERKKDADRWNEKSQQDIATFCREMDRELAIDVSAEVINKRDADGETLLHHAARYSSPEVMKALLAKEGVELDPQDDNLQTPQSLAFDLKREDVVDLFMAERRKRAGYELSGPKATELLEKIKRLTSQEINQKDGLGKTVLHYAVENYPAEVVEYLLTVQGVDKNPEDLFGRTMVHTAAARGDRDVLNVLLKETSSNVDAKDKHGQTPLHLAVLGGNEEAVKILVEKEANPNIQDRQGRTPLYLAVSRGGLKWSRYPTKVAEVLLQAGADPNLPDNEDKTPLQVAVEKNIPNLVKSLLSRKARLREENGEKEKVLNYVVLKCPWDVLEVLLEKYILIDDEIKALAELAVEKDKLEAFEILMTKAIIFEPPENKRENLFEIAVIRGHVELAIKLWRRGFKVHVENLWNSPVTESRKNLLSVLVED